MGAKHLTLTDRRIIEKLRGQGQSIKQIASFLDLDYSTIWRELRRGMCIQRISDLTEEERYCADFAEMRHRAAMQSKGLEKKIVSCPELAIFLEKKMLEEKYSPQAALVAAVMKILKLRSARLRYIAILQRVFSGRSPWKNYHTRASGQKGQKVK